MGHGGNIYEIEEKYKIPRSELLDYSANINPLGVPLELKQHIIENTNALINYPDPDYRELKAAIAEFYQLGIEDIILGNGAAEVIHAFIRTLKPKRALLLQPSFSEYERALELLGAEVLEVYLKEEAEFQVDVVELMQKAEKGVDLIVLCNPNNPTGRLIAGPQLKRLLDYCEKRNIYLMVDEAFMDFADAENSRTLLQDYRSYQRLFVVRAFTKFFGIPGLRLGFGATVNKQLLQQMKKSSLPWNINTFAAGFGMMLKKDNAYIKKTYGWLRQERELFVRKLKQINGLKVFNPDGNFILIKLATDEINTTVLKERMLRHKILIRECKNFKGLDERFFRIAIKDRSTNRYFIEALRDSLEAPI